MISTRKGLIALSPLLVFILIYLVTSLVTQDFYKIPISIAFLISCIYAIILNPSLSISKKIEIFSKGAGASNILLMIWIFILAGAFANSAKAMGSIDATVHLIWNILPGNMIYIGMFLASCFISISIGTSVGTIVALVPIAAGLAHSTGAPVAMMAAIVVGGSFFGDNLSFISDTTIVATSTQGCKMSDKFKVNSFIVFPAVIICILIYIFLGRHNTYITSETEFSFIKVIPYLVVLLTSLFGLNVVVVLTIGILLTAIIGISDNSYNIFGCFQSMNDGIMSMSELIIITLLAGGLLETIRSNGGIDFIIQKLTQHIHGKRGAEFAIAFLVSLVNMCTANNTVAILTVGDVSKNIGDKFGVDNRKAASILDTFSCCVQGLIPYGAQILMAAGLTQVNPVKIIPHLYYPALIGLSAFMAILLRFPKRYS